MLTQWQKDALPSLLSLYPDAEVIRPPTNQYGYVVIATEKTRLFLSKNGEVIVKAQAEP